MNLREEINKALEALPEDALQGVFEYIQFIMQPEQVEPTTDELKAIERGRAEFDRGEFSEWEDTRRRREDV